MRFRTTFTAIAALAAMCVGASAHAGTVVLGKLGRMTKASMVRKSPSKASLVLFSVKPQQYLVINQAPKAGWYRVLLQNGTYGYVESGLVERLPYNVTSRSGRETMVASRGTAPGSARALMADNALQYEGTPYVWGGNDISNGIDCSGFVKKMYGKIGLSLPRTAAEQALVGSPISRLEDLQKGDRLYFWDAKRGKIGHTGIYIGGGNFVHSSSGRGGVATDYLGSKHWLKILVAARR